MGGAPAGRDSRFSTMLGAFFIFSIPISRLSLSLAWQGPVRTGFSEISVCGGRAPQERRGKNTLETRRRLAVIHKFDNGRLIGK